jgi:hypothetical protein
VNVNVDTLALAIRLEAGGFTVEQARALAAALGDTAQVADLVTNTDLLATKADVKADLEHQLALLEQRMTIRLGGMLVVMTGVIVTLSHYWH